MTCGNSIFIWSHSVGQEHIGITTIMLPSTLIMGQKHKIGCSNITFCQGRSTRLHSLVQLASLLKTFYQLGGNNICYKILNNLQCTIHITVIFHPTCTTSQGQSSYTIWIGRLTVQRHQLKAYMMLIVKMKFLKLKNQLEANIGLILA